MLRFNNPTEIITRRRCCFFYFLRSKTAIHYLFFSRSGSYCSSPVFTSIRFFAQKSTQLLHIHGVGNWFQLHYKVKTCHIGLYIFLNRLSLRLLQPA